MKTFHNKPELKEMMLEEVLKHQKADEIIQGSYESRGKYCAVGCSIESLNTRLGKHYSHGDHSVYETELGIPKIIARLEDRIFEGLERKKAKMFPLRFIQAVPVGVDLSLVWPKFAIWLLGDEKDGVIKYVETDEQKKIIIDIVELYKRVIAGESIESLKKEFAIAATAAATAADAAAYAAYAAAAATAATAADAAAAAVRKNHYSKCADKLLEILAT
jgi:hypothetical protein